MTALVRFTTSCTATAGEQTRILAALIHADGFGEVVKEENAGPLWRSERGRAVVELDNDHRCGEGEGVDHHDVGQVDRYTQKI